MPPVRRARRPRRPERRLFRARPRTARFDRREDDRRRRRRHELRALGHRSAPPRVRPRSAPGRAHRRAPGEEGGEAHDLRRRGARARARRRRGRRRSARGFARRNHGRSRDGGYRENDERPARGGVVGSRRDPADVAAARNAHRRLPPFRARRGSGVDPGSARPGREPAAGGGRRHPRPGADRRAWTSVRAPPRRPAPHAAATALGRRPPRSRLRGGGALEAGFLDREAGREASDRRNPELSGRRLDRGRPRRGGAPCLGV